MRIKRFVAPDMRTALQMVREEHGPHAVILSNRKIDGGVEVVSAIDYDEVLVQETLRAIAPPPPPLRAVEPAEARPAEARVATALDNVRAQDVANPVVVKPQIVWEDPGLDKIRREISGMRELIEREVGRFAEERLRGVPVRGATLDELLSYGVEPDLARNLVAQIPAEADIARARGMALALLAKSLVIEKPEPLDGAGVIALVGPTGVGKTTTIAKLAARYAAQHSARDVALVTTDTYRVGAREQLAHYGRMLGMPVFEANATSSLSELLDRLADYKLVLIDTAGLGQRDRALNAQLSWLRAAQRIRSYLVLPANAQADDLDEVVQRFRPAAPVGVILTKLDETGHLGGVLSLAVRQQLPLSYVTDGQRVPEDIHRVEAHRLVLRLGELRTAAERNLSGEETSHAIA